MSDKLLEVSDIIPAMLDDANLAGEGCLHLFSVAGRMQKRARSPEVHSAVERAKESKSSTGRPFWDSLFDHALTLSPAGLNELLQLAQFHQKMSAVARSANFSLSGDAFSATLVALMDDQHGSQIAALSSRLRLDGGRIAHIPMLDYRVPVSDLNTRFIKTQLKSMSQTGWLLQSGRSYHFLGDQLLVGDDGHRAFLGEALLFNPVVDGRWIAHQLIEGASALRVSTGDAKQPMPRVLVKID